MDRKRAGVHGLRGNKRKTYCQCREKRVRPPLGALFLFENILQFTPLESLAVYGGAEGNFLRGENMGFNAPCEPFR